MVVLGRPGVNPAFATANCDLGGVTYSFSMPQFLLLYYGAGNDGDDDDHHLTCTCTS